MAAVSAQMPAQATMAAVASMQREMMRADAADEMSTFASVGSCRFAIHTLTPFPSSPPSPLLTMLELFVV